MSRNTIIKRNADNNRSNRVRAAVDTINKGYYALRDMSFYDPSETYNSVQCGEDANDSKTYLPFENVHAEKNTDDSGLPIDRKMLLTVTEAAEYSNIGINKLNSLLRQPDCPYVLYVGAKKLVKRKIFEEYIYSISEV